MEYLQDIKIKLNINQFYSFRSKLLSSTFQVTAIDLEEINYEKLIMGDYSDIKFPIIFKHKYGDKLLDLIDTGHWLIIVSNKIKNILIENKISGVSFYEVIVLDKKNNRLDGYCGLSVTGRCGEIDNSKSEIIEKQNTPNAPVSFYYKGLNVGIEEWDGSDFFIPKNNFGIIISRKVFDILKTNKFTNIKMTNLSEVETLKY